MVALFKLTKYVCFILTSIFSSESKNGVDCRGKKEQLISEANRPDTPISKHDSLLLLDCLDIKN